MQTGASMDLLVRFDEELDLACEEAGRAKNEIQNDTKVLVESGLKSPKVAHNIMVYLNKITNSNMSLTRKIEIVIITAGKNNNPLQ
ncbi:hypothetical protein BX666DRAFT_1886501 [Dichotomocladium elegans]|nr:hypothetical protein BX666DRAFT_1886501 [Dichotomocladium elegans]